MLVQPGPTATPDRATTPQNVPVTLSPLGNDTPGNATDGSDGSWDVTSVTSVRLLPDGLPRGSTVSADGKTATVPGQGTFTVGADGVVTFTPEAGFTGTVAPIGYSVADANGTTVEATVRVVVGPAGVVAPNKVAAKPGTPVTVDVLANDTPPTGEEWVPSSVCLVPHGTCLKEYTEDGVGTWVVNPDGTITFTPADGYSGTATIAYSVTDTAGNVYTTTLTITVPPGSLAQTGAELAPFLLTGFGALFAGVLLVGVARRRRRVVVEGA
ncbi:cadherin-like domain-containing protein [Phycicoccus sp. HDW14]|uniref:Ig-like domain-containing protein n=1 Tax=Phycicoccus sp. HDW14 TaxID=2714941 RepID=UPI00140C4C5B|nr:cadherin-like domain-containing protein [Phycicoccus sp. HDW14]QIM22441.1 cadherin-like domain-containing protein [Phycicoccus sp. HDW14]